MLQYIDTILGFALVMSVVSLLITIVTQIVSSLFGLRGRSLSNALVALFQKVDPQIDQELKDSLSASPIVCSPIPPSPDSLLPTTGKGGTLWRRATAIRPIELLNLLEQLASPPPSRPPTVERRPRNPTRQQMRNPTRTSSNSWSRRPSACLKS
jgi:hypothetical protein